MQQSYIQQEELYFGIYGYIFYYLECEMCQCMICNCWWYNYCGVCCGGVHSAELVCSYWLCKPPDLMAIDPECCHICACDGLGGNCLYYGSICCAPQSVRQWSAIRSGGGGMGGNTIIINNNQPIYSQPQQGYPNNNMNPGYPGGANVGVNMGYGNNPVEMRSPGYNNGMGVNMNAGGVNMNTGVNMNAGYNANMNQGYAANNYNQGMNTNANNGVSVNTNLNGNANMNMGVNPNQNMNLNMNGGGMNMNTGVGMNINSPGMNAKVSF